jgi:hypothetical protein
MLLNDHWVNEEIKEEIKKFLLTKRKHNLQNTWATAKAMLGGKFKAMSAYVENTKLSQINDLMPYLKILEIQAKLNPKLAEEK